MFTVALIGPDGAGKSTVSRQLERELTLPVKSLYMGINFDCSKIALPTTRLISALRTVRGERPRWEGPPDPDRIALRPENVVKRLAAEFKSALRVTNLMAEEWFRQGIAWYYRRRGQIVLFDRHYVLDYHGANSAPRSSRRPLAERIHSLMLQRLYPRPDLVIYLDASPQVLHARKGEATIEWLQRRREEYLAMHNVVRHFITVDASRPPREVAQTVARHIRQFYESRS